MLGVFRRRPKLPASRRPALEPDERVLAWAPTDGAESVVVATNRGLWLPGRDRLGWHEIHKAVWSADELRVTPARVDEQLDGYAVVADEPEVGLRLTDPGELPYQVRTRVTRSVAYTAHFALSGGGGARVVARRVSGVDGLTWTVRYDPGTPVDPVVTQATAELVQQARAAAEPEL